MKNLVIVIIFFTLYILHFTSSFAQQQFTSTSKKAVKLFLESADLYSAGDYAKALILSEKAVSEDPSFIEAYILQGDIHADMRNPLKAIESYRKAVQTAPEFSPNLYFILGNQELAIGLYAEARKDYLRFLDFRDIPKQKQERAVAALYQCDFGMAATANPVPFNLINEGGAINSEFDDYINALTADERKMYFTRKLPKNAQTIDQQNEFEEDFFISVKKDTAWSMATSLGPPINTHGNEGAITISPDGQLIFFAACNREDGYGSCDIYWSRKAGERWGNPENLGPIVNSPSWDSQPTFSSDGKTLYFASKRSGGKGSSDIWKTEMQENGEWTVPVNLGDSVNTRDAEMAPFIHPDDQTLYFTSRGHPGMGGFDLFLSRREEGGNWKKPSNLGYPINTFSDETTLVVNASGDLAYISSDKAGGKGKQDIYSFRLYKEAQPVKTTYLKGIVYDKVSKQKLKAKFELTDLSTGRKVIESVSDRISGEFLVVLPTNRNYALNVSREGYLFYSDHFELTGENSKARPYIKDIPLQPITIGETVVLKNIFFDTDKSDLKPESTTELDKLVALLKSNPKIKIEISGHTDNAGTAEYNLTLSQNRAKAVFDYLVSQGISTSRLTYAGYGLSKPVDTNDTEQGRANNRRTEFKVLDS